MDASTSDEGLLARARGGDEDALAELLERHGPRARRALAGRVPARHRGALSEEDLLQQTFTDAFLDVGCFVPCGAGAFGAWLERLARDNLADALRALEAEKRGGRAPRGAPAPEASAAALLEELFRESQTSPSGHLRREEAQAALRAAVAALPHDWARVVELYDLQGRPIDEVARLLGRSAGAVHLLRHRAHRRLRERLSGGFSGTSA